MYLIANCLVGITWAFGIPYLLGKCAEFDNSGQMAALGGFASTWDSLQDRVLAALVVGSDNYALVIYNPRRRGADDQSAGGLVALAPCWIGSRGTADGAHGRWHAVCGVRDYG